MSDLTAIQGYYIISIIVIIIIINNVIFMTFRKAKSDSNPT